MNLSGTLLYDRPAPRASADVLGRQVLVSRRLDYDYYANGILKDGFSSQPI